MEEYLQAAPKNLAFLETLRTAVGFGLIVLSLFCIAIAGLWLVGDFVAAAVYSPNLDSAAQLADFDDLSYLSQTLRDYRFGLGLLLLSNSIAAIMLALLVLRIEGQAKPIFMVGGVLIVLSTLISLKVFYWPVIIQLSLGFIALYLATEWSELTAEAAEVNAHSDVDAVKRDIDPARNDVDPVDEETLLLEADSDAVKAMLKGRHAEQTAAQEQDEAKSARLVVKDSVAAGDAVVASKPDTTSGEKPEATRQQPELTRATEFDANTDPIETDPEIEKDHSGLSVDDWTAAEDADTDNLIPVINDRVETEIDTDTAFIAEAELLAGATGAQNPQHSHPKNVAKPAVAAPPHSRNKLKRRKRGGWRDWKLLDWAILGMILILLIGIAVLLLAG